MLRIALNISGHIREFDEFKTLFYRNVLDPLREYAEVDIFCSTWNKLAPRSSHADLGSKQSFSLNSQRLGEDDLIYWFDPKGLVIEDFELTENSFLLKNYTNFEPAADASAYYKDGILFVIPQYWKIHTCNCLRKKYEELNKNKSYDWVIRYRPDWIPLDKIPDLRDLDPNFVYIDEFSNGLASDYFAVGDSANMDIYCSIFLELKNILKEKFDFGGDKIYYKYLNEKQLPIKEKTLIRFERYKK